MIKLPLGLDINNLIDDLRIMSWEAAEILLTYADLIKNKNFKSNILENLNDEDPVTTADLKVNELIINRINQNYQTIDWKILSEENVKFEPNTCDINSDWLWILDPLDGTKDFIQCTGNYAMHLSLNYKNKPYLGVVLIPEKNELWISNGNNVWCERRDGSLVKTNVSNKKTLQEMIIVTSKNHKNQKLKKLIEKVNFKNVIEMGSIGCKITSILKGESDIYISLSLPEQSAPKDWDFAAPDAILSTAGGSITNLENIRLTYNQPYFEQRGLIVASGNKNLHEKLCLQMKDIIEEFDFI